MQEQKTPTALAQLLNCHDGMGGIVEMPFFDFLNRIGQVHSHGSSLIVGIAASATD